MTSTVPAAVRTSMAVQGAIFFNGWPYFAFPHLMHPMGSCLTQCSGDTSSCPLRATCCSADLWGQWMNFAKFTCCTALGELLHQVCAGPPNEDVNKTTTARDHAEPQMRQVMRWETLVIKICVALRCRLWYSILLPYVHKVNQEHA